VLSGCNLVLERPVVTTAAAFGGRQLTQLLLEPAANLDRTQSGIAGQQADQVIPIGIQLLAASRIVPLLGNDCFFQAQVFTHAITRNLQLPADGPNGKPFAVVM